MTNDVGYPLQWLFTIQLCSAVKWLLKYIVHQNSKLGCYYFYYYYLV